MDTQIEHQKANYFIRLFRGQISLPMTFWVWFFFVNLIINVLSGFLIGKIELAPTPEQINTSIVLMVIIFIYTLFILIALWRSASNHETKLWANIVKIIVVVNIFLFAQEGYSFGKMNFDQEYAIKEGIKNLNQRVPVNVNKETMLTFADLDMKNIQYHYQLMTMDINNSIIDKTLLKDNIEQFLCQDKNSLHILNAGYSYVFSYYDKNREFILKVKTQKDACDTYQQNNEILKKILATNAK